MVRAAFRGRHSPVPAVRTTIANGSSHKSSERGRYSDDWRAAGGRCGGICEFARSAVARSARRRPRGPGCVGSLRLSHARAARLDAPAARGIREDDGVRFRRPTPAGGANRVSLVVAQRTHKDFGACDQHGRRYVRPPAEASIPSPVLPPLTARLQATAADDAPG
ncbi:CPCC family cysteine-rich protein [Streptomyces sp. NPDC001356]